LFTLATAVSGTAAFIALRVRLTSVEVRPAISAKVRAYIKYMEKGGHKTPVEYKIEG
jgi:hypothetical protein